MNNKATTYHIGDLAKVLEISARSIRYYEELGLIAPSRTGGGFRLYSDHDRELIKLIVRFKDLGMSLDEIRSLVAPNPHGLSRENVEELKQALLSRKGEFEQKIENLRHSIGQIDDVVEQLARCETCNSQMEKDSCGECLKSRGEEVSPLLDRLR